MNGVDCNLSENTARDYPQYCEGTERRDSDIGIATLWQGLHIINTYAPRSSSPSVGYALSLSSNCSAGENTYCRIITVLSSDVRADAARIIAITTNW